MKKSNYSFVEGFLGMPSETKSTNKAFDWVKAAEIIKDRLKLHPDLIAEAGLQNDWSSTGCSIFEEGTPNSDGYSYLESSWAIPTLVLTWDGSEQEELPCFETEGKYDSDSKWDEESLSILGVSNGN